MNARMRNRYLTDSVTTASPGTLLVRLYNRLVLDLERAEQAIADGDHGQTNEMLCHAQQIITELHSTLDVDAWSGGPGLAQIYVFTLDELVQANLTKDAGRVAAVRDLFEPLRDAWQDAVLATTEPAVPAQIAAGT